MFCAPVTLLHYFEEYKTGGLFCPPSEITGGGAKQPPGFIFLKYCNNVLTHETCLYSFRLHCLYISQGGWCLSRQSLKKGPVSSCVILCI